MTKEDFRERIAELIEEALDTETYPLQTDIDPLFDEVRDGAFDEAVQKITWDGSDDFAQYHLPKIAELIRSLKSSNQKGKEV